MPIYALTCQLASHEPLPAEMQQLPGALAGNQADRDRFLDLVAGATPFAASFAPENSGHIMAAAGAAAADRAMTSRQAIATLRVSAVGAGQGSVRPVPSACHPRRGTMANGFNE